jgi:cysteine sulfinate desulfinase/cysteine desulfurase-like protein
MFENEARLKSAIRFSLGPDLTLKDIDHLIQTLKDYLKK